MEANVERYPGVIENLGDLPKGLTASKIFYDNEKEKLLFINDNQREIFAAVTSKNALGLIVIYLVYYFEGENNSESKNKLRSIVSYYKKSGHKPKLIITPAEKKLIVISLNQSFIAPETKRVYVKENKDTENGITFAHRILYDAMKAGASDLHVESDGKTAEVRFRVNKELFVYDTISHSEAESFGSTCYGTFVKGGDDQVKGTGSGVYKPGNLLEGEFTRKIDDVKLKARMVNIGHNHGESFDLIMRLIDRNKVNKALRFEALGFSKNSCSLLRRLETLSRGMVLTVGVTGSGKSTSQQNMMQHERDRTGGTRKILSVESPVEDVIDGVSQITAGEKKDNPDQDFSFDRLNTLFMRADPDSIAYGEIRDSTTAEASLKGVESGHLVYGTMHASDCMSVFSRFESFNVDRSKVCRPKFLRVVLFQHLLPKLCSKCSIPHVVGDKIPEKYDELFAVKSLMSPETKKLHLKEFMDIRNNLAPDSSLIRELQRRGIISSKEVIEMRRRMEYMNAESDNEGFTNRLRRVVSGSLLSDDEINIRFRGPGCNQCFQGFSGVVPASEVLIPDDEFLSLVRSHQMDKAEIYWKSTLRGRSATSDTYDKILTGLVDPRSVEEELEDLGN